MVKVTSISVIVEGQDVGEIDKLARSILYTALGDGYHLTAAAITKNENGNFYANYVGDDKPPKVGNEGTDLQLNVGTAGSGGGIV